MDLKEWIVVDVQLVLMQEKMHSRRLWSVAMSAVHMNDLHPLSKILIRHNEVEKQESIPVYFTLDSMHPLGAQ